MSAHRSTSTAQISAAAGSSRVGGALIVAAGVRPAAAPDRPGCDARRQAPESWIEIHADNTVLIRTGKSDFGQSSIYTAYRQIVAEELSMPLSAMTTVISGDTDRTPDGGGTFGLLRYAGDQPAQGRGLYPRSRAESGGGTAGVANAAI